MSRPRKRDKSGTMLELWRPPNGAGDVVGCLASTFTFSPGLFDEQCLARFMEIESEPDREDLAFTLERESRLGGIYAGVLVDYRQAGVEHSLRWDVLPVRIPSGKQHAKLSILAWSNHIRLIVASANLSEAGYRSNFEVASALDFHREESDSELLGAAIGFLRELLGFVPGHSHGLHEVDRAENFLRSISDLTAPWAKRSGNRSVRHNLAFTLPRTEENPQGLATLETAVQSCRKRGGSPKQMLIASPFFDQDDKQNRTMSAACKLMARGLRRDVDLYVPCAGGDDEEGTPRLQAPKSLWETQSQYYVRAKVYSLPAQDNDMNQRPWHAKMLGLRADAYSALMIGSSNFTCAGMGVGAARNAEANLVIVVDRVAHSREIGELEGVWPEGSPVEDPASAEWLGARPEDDQDAASGASVPAGFLSATYRAGDKRQIAILTDPKHLPKHWSIHACSTPSRVILTSDIWRKRGAKLLTEIPWDPPVPPVKLLVKWEENEAFIPINVEDGGALPPPAELGSMSAEQMLMILAASDPSAAFRAWAKTQRSSDSFDDDLDSATAVDLDPLRSYDLQATFLHRVRRRAKVLAQLRANLERPASSVSAVEWRLRGLIGIEALARKLADDVMVTQAPDEALLTVADLLVVVSEVAYQPVNGSLSKAIFDRVFRKFLAELALDLEDRISSKLPSVSAEALAFWQRVLTRCKT
jgi:hypothetical protein